MPSLAAYLHRIGLDAAPAADLPTLRTVHRAHVEAIPYENLDVQLGRPVTRDVAAAFDKIVTLRRGGWCYEMNGLLAWALEEIGFRVRRLAGAVGRAAGGDATVGNHLVLLIDLDGEIWLADAGFGDGLIEPTLLREGAFEVGPLTCRLNRIEGGWWRYSNDPSGAAPSFDFHADVSDDTLLDAACVRLQTDPESPFVQTAVVQRWRDGEHASLRGRVLTTVSASGAAKATIADAATYVAVLRDRLALDLPEAATLWPKISARHEAVFGAGA